MAATYLVMAIPFLLSGGIVGIILSAAGRDVPKLYAADLLGAGFGCVAVVPALYLGPPWMLLPLLSGAVLAGAGWCCMRTPWSGKGILVLPLAGTLVLAVMWCCPCSGTPSHKGIPYDHGISGCDGGSGERRSAGLIHVVGSSLIREVPG